MEFQASSWLWVLRTIRQLGVTAVSVELLVEGADRHALVVNMALPERKKMVMVNLNWRFGLVRCDRIDKESRETHNAQMLRLNTSHKWWGETHGTNGAVKHTGRKVLWNTPHKWCGETHGTKSALKHTAQMVRWNTLHEWCSETHRTHCAVAYWCDEPNHRRVVGWNMTGGVIKQTWKWWMMNPTLQFYNLGTWC